MKISQFWWKSPFLVRFSPKCAMFTQMYNFHKILQYKPIQQLQLRWKFCLVYYTSVNSLITHPSCHGQMAPLVASKTFFFPESFQTIGIRTHQKTALLVRQHFCQREKLGVAPGPRTFNRNISLLMDQLHMPLEVTCIPESHIAW